jgi:outer membrane receptor protein involved in Fe transport
LVRETKTWFATVAALSASTPAWGEEPIVITVTRVPETEATVPAAETVISGVDLRARGAFDLRSALSQAAGVEVLPGSDAGPASSVVASQGLAEMDAYLLVVDGVPYGGAFNPATATLDLIDVDRIEVVRGAAPVTYGATSFVGVIHIIRSAAGKQPTRGLVQLGTRDSGRAAFATSLSSGQIGQSLLGSLERRGFSQVRGKFTRGHLLYRAATDLGAGRLHFDLDATTLDQTPYSPHPREGSGLSTRFPRDANINPADARADQDRIQANLGFDTQLGGLQWSSIVSASRTWARNVRGFLREDFDDSGATSNADGFRQRVRLTDVYADSHVSSASKRLDWVAGVDWLYGSGRQRSANFEYAVLPDGSNAPRSTSLNIDESTLLTDRRSFAGIYAQAIVRPNSALTLLGGVRLNRTIEKRCGGEEEGSTPPDADECETRRKTRLSGLAGVSYALWRSDRNGLTAFADYRNTYKPAAIDFGPEAEPEILAPETAHGWEVGLKSEMAGGRFRAELSYFDTDFRNLVIRENVGGLPALANAGRERFRGVEGEFRWSPTKELTVFGSYARHLAKFTDYERLRPDGTIQQLAGKRLELSPKNLASAIVAYAPGRGPQASATLRYVGSRFLNKGNSITTGAYATLDARVGWKFGGGWSAFVEAENLTNRRDPVTESELGDAQFYRLSGRRILATLSYGL